MRVFVASAVMLAIMMGWSGAEAPTDVTRVLMRSPAIVETPFQLCLLALHNAPVVYQLPWRTTPKD